LHWRCFYRGIKKPQKNQKNKLPPYLTF